MGVDSLLGQGGGRRVDSCRTGSMESCFLFRERIEKLGKIVRVVGSWSALIYIGVGYDPLDLDLLNSSSSAGYDHSLNLQHDTRLALHPLLVHFLLSTNYSQSQTQIRQWAQY